MARIHVAILGAGRIAQHMADTLVKMAEDVRYADLVEPYAVAARNAVRAADFAAKYGLAPSPSVSSSTASTTSASHFVGFSLGERFIRVPAFVVRREGIGKAVGVEHAAIVGD